MVRRAGLVLGSLVVLGLTFLLGVLVGRQWAGPGPGSAGAEAERARGAPRRSALADAATVRPPRHDDKLTFYETLTAPPAALPAPAALKPGAAGGGDGRARPVSPAAAMPAGSTGAPAAHGPEPAAATGTGGFAVQVGAFRSRSQAVGLQQHLAAQGVPAQVVGPGAGDGGQPHYRVRVGGYPTREEARRMARRLQAEQGLAGYVVAP